MVQRKQRTVKQGSSFQFKKEYVIYLSVMIITVLLFLFFPKDLFVSEQKTTPEIKKEHSVQPTVEKVRRVRLPQIEILNGCGQEGITKLFTPFFRKENIDVIAVNNYKDFEQKYSFLLVHDKTVKQTAIQIASRLGLKTENVREAFSEDPINELTLVLGQDFGKLQYKQ